MKKNRKYDSEFYMAKLISIGILILLAIAYLFSGFVISDFDHITFKIYFKSIFYLIFLPLSCWYIIFVYDRVKKFWGEEIPLFVFFGIFIAIPVFLYYQFESAYMNNSLVPPFDSFIIPYIIFFSIPTVVSILSIGTKLTIRKLIKIDLPFWLYFGIFTISLFYIAPYIGSIY